MPGRNQLQLPVGVDLREGLVAAFDAIIAYAVDQARQPPHTAGSVHEFRRSIRRARAVVDMCRTCLESGARKEIQRQLRAAVESTSSLRDLDVLSGTLSGLELNKKLQKQATAYRALLEQRRIEARSQRAPALLAGARRISPLPGRFAAGLAREITWSDLTEGLRRTYQLARRQRETAGTSSKKWKESSHQWRKRTKEISYQLELLTTGLDKKYRKLHTRYERIARRLGKATDLLVLAGDITATRKGKKRPKKLIAAILDAAEDRIDTLYAKTEKRYSDKPKAFANSATEVIREARASISRARLVQIPDPEPDEE
jgi:CHAD domain-containing protein